LAENEVIVPTSGNPALDPSRAESGLVAKLNLQGKFSDTRSEQKFETRVGYFGGKHWSEMAEEGEKNRRRSLSESDRQKEDLDEYWRKRKDDAKRNPDNRPKQTQYGGGGESGGGRRGWNGRGMQFGISNSSGVDYAVMRFKSKVMQDACSAKFTSTFPMNTHLPQVCGPFRPITISSQGGLPQSSLQESIGTGIVPNMDA
jgi:hypothetical protein